MMVVNSSQEKNVFMQLRQKFKGPPFYRGWSQNRQTFRLTLILSKLSVIGIFNITTILSLVYLG